MTALLILVAVSALAFAGVDRRARRSLADDSRDFYSHEEKISYFAFLESVAVSVAEEAEAKARAGGPEAIRWEKEASESRARAAAAARARKKYEYRASLKQRGW
ncbi:MAG: hypothetical protein U0800_05940 [Isosphaeraceae bacterium]